MAAPRRVLRRLDGGMLLLMRPVTARDRRGIERGFAQLSAQSRYRRFLQPLQRLSPSEISRLVDLDQCHRAAWGAIELHHCEGIGIARYARSASAPEAADWAVTVLDQWQCRGVARLLFRMLAATARANGITRLEADVLNDNMPALALCRSLGAKVERGERGLVRVVIELFPATNKSHAG